MRRLAALLAAGIALAVVPLEPAHAAPPDVDVVIDALAPVLPTDDGTITVSGRVVNAGATSLSDATVRLRVSSRPLADRAALADALAPTDAATNGADDVALAATVAPLPTQLAPGQQAAFTLTAPTRSVRRNGPGVYVLGVEVQAADAGGGQPTRRQDERTVVPLMDAGRSVGLAWLWPVTATPDRNAAGVFLDDTVPTALAPNGRLDALVRMGAGHGDAITWVVDPELLQAAQAITTGYQVLRDGTAVVGDQSADGARWLDQLRAATQGETVLALPYANVDANALRRAGMDSDVVHALAQAGPITQGVLGSQPTTGFAWAPSGQFDKQTANLLANAGVTRVVLRESAMPPVDPTAPPASGIASYGTIAGRIDAILVDDALSATLTGPQGTDAEIVAARQRFLAETALIAQATTQPTTVVVAPADLQWQPSAPLLEPLLRATQGASWLHKSTLRELLAMPRTDRVREPYRKAARAEELPAQYLQSVAKAQGKVERLAAVLQDPSTVVPPFSEALLRSESAAWRPEPAGRSALLADVTAELAQRVALVHVLSSGNVVFSGDSGRVPVTIANDSDQEVTVGLSLIGHPQARLVSAPMTDIAIAPGHKVSVEVDARVLGSEPLDVDVQLLTPQGAVYGRPAVISLGTTAYARAAAWVMGLAFAGLAVFVIIGVVRRIRAARDHHVGR